MNDKNIVDILCTERKLLKSLIGLSCERREKTLTRIQNQINAEFFDIPNNAVCEDVVESVTDDNSAVANDVQNKFGASLRPLLLLSPPDSLRPNTSNINNHEESIHNNNNNNNNNNSSNQDNHVSNDSVNTVEATSVACNWFDLDAPLRDVLLDFLQHSLDAVTYPVTLDVFDTALRDYLAAERKLPLLDAALARFEWSTSLPLVHLLATRHSLFLLLPTSAVVARARSLFSADVRLLAHSKLACLQITRPHPTQLAKLSQLSTDLSSHNTNLKKVTRQLIRVQPKQVTQIRMLRERSRAVTPTKRLASDERGSETSGNTDGHTTDTDTRDDQSERSTQSSGSKTARSNTGAASSGTKRRRKQDALLLSDQSVTLAQLLTHPSVIERRRARTVRRVSRLLTAESLAQRTARSRFVSKDERAVQKYCDHMTRSACYEARAARFRAGNLKVIEPPCTKLHYVRIVQRHTNDLLGDCTWLNQCFNMRSCPYVHYRLDERDLAAASADNTANDGTAGSNQQTSTSDNKAARHAAALRRAARYDASLLDPALAKHAQWINCDVRTFPFEVLGKFGVIMADPPWKIHMKLPYGTMSDNEMRQLEVAKLQDSGFIFLWVTGRAMELGRELLSLWGYERCEEIVWIKVNQLQRTPRAGRTGHWINHAKEHCLIGVKGSPHSNRQIDTDVVVSLVRETSRKPDEMYSLIERLSPGTRKIELFGRPHNVWPGWLTLGNQFGDSNVLEESILKKLPAEVLATNIGIKK